jgi:hypothetical protein
MDDYKSELQWDWAGFDPGEIPGFDVEDWMAGVGADHSAG